MEKAPAVYRLRAEECLALALDARDGAHQTELVEMALYWFNRPKRLKKPSWVPHHVRVEAASAFELQWPGFVQEVALLFSDRLRPDLSEN